MTSTAGPLWLPRPCLCVTLLCPPFHYAHWYLTLSSYLCLSGSRLIEGMGLVCCIHHCISFFACGKHLIIHRFCTGAQ